MKFKNEWDVKTRIELLERWVLVQSFIYYELNSNVSSDFVYDANVNELFRYMEQYPEETEKSRYAVYFDALEPGCTSGFMLLDLVRKNDKELYRHLHFDATIAIQQKEKHKND